MPESFIFDLDSGFTITVTLQQALKKDCINMQTNHSMWKQITMIWICMYIHKWKIQCCEINNSDMHENSRTSMVFIGMKFLWNWSFLWNLEWINNLYFIYPMFVCFVVTIKFCVKFIFIGMKFLWNWSFLWNLEWINNLYFIYPMFVCFVVTIKFCVKFMSKFCGHLLF